MSKRNKSKSKKEKQENLFEVYFLIISLILILPFVHSSKTLDYNSAPRLLSLSIIIIAFSLWNIISRKANLQFIKLTIFPVSILYLIWSLIILIPAVNPGEGSFDITKTILTIGLLIYASQILITHKGALTILVKSIIISAIIATSVGMFQYFTKVSGRSESDLYMVLYAVKGLMAHKNQFAISLLLMLPFTTYALAVFKKWWRGAAVYSSLMILISIVIIQTRSVWIATIVFILTLLLLSVIFLLNNNLKSIFLSHKKTIAIAFGSLFLISLTTFVIIQNSGTSSLMKQQMESTFSTKSSNAQWRIKMWNASMHLAKDNLIVGVGAGNWKNAIIPYYYKNFGNEYQNWRRPHNDYLWVLTEKGIPGLLLFIAIFGIILFYGFKILFYEKEKNKLLIIILMISGITSYLFVSLFTFPIERINQQVYLAIMMAVVISFYYEQNKKNSIESANFSFRTNLLILLFSALSFYYSYLFLRQELTVKRIATAMNSGQTQRAVKYCDIAYTPFTTIDNNNIPIKMYRGVSNMNAGYYQLAYNDLKVALKEFPNQMAVLNNLAIVSSELNKHKEAVSYLNRALKLFPHYEKSLSNMVIVHYRNKEYTKSYEFLLNQDTRHPDKQYQNFKTGLEKLINK